MVCKSSAFPLFLLSSLIKSCFFLAPLSPLLIIRACCGEISYTEITQANWSTIVLSSYAGGGHSSGAQNRCISSGPDDSSVALSAEPGVKDPPFPVMSGGTLQPQRGGQHWEFMQACWVGQGSLRSSAEAPLGSTPIPWANSRNLEEAKSGYLCPPAMPRNPMVLLGPSSPQEG